MIVGIQALEHNSTSKLVHLPLRKKANGCKPIYIIKVRPNDEANHLRARLVNEGHT